MKIRILSAILAAQALFVLSCGKQDEDNSEVLSLLVLNEALTAPVATPVTEPEPLTFTGNQTYLDRVNYALDTWDIGLEKGIFAESRSWTGGLGEPVNWITVSDDTCSAAGLPADTAGAGNCPVGTVYDTDGVTVLGTVVGTCGVSRYDDGKIAYTTLILYDKYMSGEFLPGHTEEQRRATVIHEVGHCLGLQHWGNTNAADSTVEIQADDATGIGDDVMVNSADGRVAVLPSAQELNAVKDAYQPQVQAPSESLPTPLTAHALRFSEVVIGNGIRERHFTFPVFTVSAVMGAEAPVLNLLYNITGAAGQPPEGLTTHWHNFIITNK